MNNDLDTFGHAIWLKSGLVRNPFSPFFPFLVLPGRNLVPSVSGSSPKTGFDLHFPIRGQLAGFVVTQLLN